MAISTGTGRNDSLVGTQGNDRISGLNGHDTLRGWDGHDTLVGGDGHDLVDGDAGNDLLLAGVGDDALYGNEGFDTLNGGDGIDEAGYTSDTGAIDADLERGTVIDGYGDTDTLIDIEFLIGSDHNDQIGGDGQINYLNGVAGNDFIQGRGGNDRLRGGHGNDTLDGGEGVDDVRYGRAPGSVTVDLEAGTASDGYGTTDTLISIEEVIGSNYNDVIRGNGQDNLLMGLAGNDTLDGRGGNDTANYYWSEAAVRADLRIKYAQDGYGTTDKLVNIENLDGAEAGNDTLIGNGARNKLQGWGGDDVLSGKGGRDYLYGASGNDRLDGGGGSDLLFGGIGDDVLKGRKGDDWLYVSDGADTLDGGSGQDNLVFSDPLLDLRVKGLVGYIDLIGGQAYIDSDTETVQTLRNIENVYGNWTDSGDNLHVQIALNVKGSNSGNEITGGSRNDTLKGLDGNDSLVGWHGSDRLEGGRGNDVLLGRNGRDKLLGGDGKDTLEGGSGNDTLFGGANADTFVFTDDWGRDRVRDFSLSGRADVLHIAGDDEAQDFEAFVAASQQVGNDVVYDANDDGRNVITLSDVQLSSLGADDIIFF